MNIIQLILELLFGKREAPPPAQPPAPTQPKQDEFIEWSRITERKDDFGLGEWFHALEFQCNCGKCIAQKISKDLIDKLDVIREAFGSPLFITSGYRCSEYQKVLRDRGVETSTGVSQHELGRAADIVITDPKRMVELRDLLSKHFMAIGEGRTFTHVDLRADKIRRWGYKNA